MPHMPKPFFRTARNAWFVQLGKQQIKLSPGPHTSETEKAAWRVFHELMAERNSAPPLTPADNSAKSAITVASLLDKYLDWCQKHREQGTYGWYRERIQSFLDHLKTGSTLPAADLRPFHVVEWIDARETWGPTYRRGAIIAVQRPYNWAFKLGHIQENPLRHVEKPKAKRREQAATQTDFDRVVGHYTEDDPFRALITFAWETGVRPQEAKRVEARHVDLEKLEVVFPPEEAKGKKRYRRVLLTDAAAAILRPLVEKHPTGPLFLNADGNPWTRFAVACRFGRLQKKLGVKFAQYAFRHGYAQQMLEAGNDHLTVAELLGHVNGQMISTVYSHMNKAERHLRDALKRGKAAE